MDDNKGTSQILEEIANGKVDDVAMNAAHEAFERAEKDGLNTYHKIKRSFEAYAQNLTGVNRKPDWLLKCNDCDYIANGFQNSRNTSENPHFILEAHMIKEHQNKLMICPLRNNDNEIFVYSMKAKDYWHEIEGNYHTCSYCGSAHPDDVMNAMEKGEVEIGPTDKPYKAYLHNSGENPTINFKNAKFYYGHFSLEQKKRFIELYNAKRIKIGYPGYFYTLPYFMKIQVQNKS